MAEQQPPLGLERLTDHTMITLRQSLGAWAGVTGVLGATDLRVTETPTPSMQVRVAKGQVIIPNTHSPDDGPYHAFNDAPVDLDVDPSDPTNARIDLVVARVYDGFYAGDDDEWKLEVVTGTPSGDPVEPATPDNSEVVGRLEVGASAGSVTNADIEDVRANAKLRARLLHGVDLDGWEATEPGHLMTKQQIEDYVDLEKRPYRITSGNVTVSYGGGNDTNSESVTFPADFFAVGPTVSVLLTPTGSTVSGVGSVSDVTLSGCTVNARRLSGTGGSTSFRWIATQLVPPS